MCVVVSYFVLFWSLCGFAGDRAQALHTLGKHSPLSPSRSVWFYTSQCLVIGLGGYESTNKTQCPEPASALTEQAHPCALTVLCPLCCLAFFQPFGERWQPDHIHSPGQSLRDREQVFPNFSPHLFSLHWVDGPLARSGSSEEQMQIQWYLIQIKTPLSET